MAGTTPRYGLQRIQAGDSFALNGFKFSDDDRTIIENLLYTALSHHHTGTTASTPPTDVGPSLVLDTSFGNLPAGTRIFYTITWVDNIGNESVALPESFIDTAPSVTSPGTPYLAAHTTGGTLTPGNYYYVLSAYTGTTAYESQATNPAFLTIAAGSTTNKITVGFPTVPTGADGFNVYRRGPGEIQYSYLTTVAVTGGADPSPATFDDDGALTPNPVRTIPTANTTNYTNNVTITVPTSTIDGYTYPAGTVPVGYTWKVYRSYTSGQYTNNLLHHVVELTGDFSDIILGSYTDTGLGTTHGSPPIQSQFVQPPTQIDLATETFGTLPIGAVPHPVVVTFDVPGTAVVLPGTKRWVSEYPNASIVGCRVACGVGEGPSGTDVIVDVMKGTGTSPSPSTIYTTTGNRPKVTVGNEIGTRTTPDVSHLGPGDSLSVDVKQADTAATPTAKDLSVNVYMIAWGYPGITYVPDTNIGVDPVASDTNRSVTEDATL